MIFYKRINGYEVDRLDILYYYLQMQKLKKEGNWTKEYQDYKKMGGNLY